MSPRLLVLLAALCFGTTGTAEALGPDGMQPVVVGTMRIVIGGGLLAALAWRRDGQWSPVTVLVGAGGVAGFQLMFFAAIEQTGVAVGTIVALGSGPVFAGPMARTPVTARWGVATTLAVVGVAILAAASTSAQVQPGGVALAVGAGFSYAIYTVAAKRLLEQRHPPEAVMARLFGLGALLLLPVLAARGLGEVGTADGLAVAAYLGVVPTALGYALFARGLRHLPAGEVTTLTLAEPLTAAALAAIVLGERLSLVGLCGGALILAGLAILAAPRGPRRSRVPASPPTSRDPSSSTSSCDAAPQSGRPAALGRALLPRLELQHRPGSSSSPSAAPPSGWPAQRELNKLPVIPDRKPRLWTASR
jgi:DME family drug/metabolite transporter